MTFDGPGTAKGFPGLTLDPQADELDILIFESDDLPAHWERLDVFEGDGYRRIVVPVETPKGVVDANIYALI